MRGLYSRIPAALACRRKIVRVFFLVSDIRAFQLRFSKYRICAIVTMTTLPTIGINLSLTDVELSLTPPPLRGFVSPDDLWYENTTLLIGTVISVFIPLGLVIFGTIGNIMALAVFLRYQKSNKSSATFLMQTLCMVDTVYLLSVLPTELQANSYETGLMR